MIDGTISLLSPLCWIVCTHRAEQREHRDEETKRALPAGQKREERREKNNISLYKKYISSYSIPERQSGKESELTSTPLSRTIALVRWNAAHY